jgi:aryl-alcohol dehydrogenase-like predicted oxidoreductase
MAKYLEGSGPAMLAALDEIAAETRATPAQIALAWLAAQEGVTAPIASATGLDQLEELLGSMTVELSEGQLERLDAASSGAG